MSSGILGLGGSYKNAAMTGLEQVAKTQNQRDIANDQMEQSRRQSQISSTVTGAVGGAMLGMQAGSIGGPAGAVAGAAIGFLGSSLF